MDSDLVLFPEERLVDHGYQEGFHHGCEEGYSEGFVNGKEVGLNVIEEVGSYYGFATSILKYHLVNSSDAKVRNVVEALHKLLSSFQVLSPNSEANLNKIRSKYKQLMSLLKVQSKSHASERRQLNY